MFGLFKKKVKEKKPPQLFDINGIPLQEGDFVKSERYELGNCKIVLDGLHFYYQPDGSEERVSYTKMIDAITGHQKVTRIDQEA